MKVGFCDGFVCFLFGSVLEGKFYVFLGGSSGCFGLGGRDCWGFGEVGWGFVVGRFWGRWSGWYWGWGRVFFCGGGIRGIDGDDVGVKFYVDGYVMMGNEVVFVEMYG